MSSNSVAPPAGAAAGCSAIVSCPSRREWRSWNAWIIQVIAAWIIQAKSATLWKVASPLAYQSFCPVGAALNVVGERWALLIVRDLFLGPRRYSELQTGLGGIGTDVLAARLRNPSRRVGSSDRSGRTGAAPAPTRRCRRRTASGARGSRPLGSRPSQATRRPLPDPAPRPAHFSARRCRDAPSPSERRLRSSRGRRAVPNRRC